MRSEVFGSLPHYLIVTCSGVGTHRAPPRLQQPLDSTSQRRVTILWHRVSVPKKYICGTQLFTKRCKKSRAAKSVATGTSQDCLGNVSISFVQQRHG